MSRLRVAVVGVGSVGQHHARILAAMPPVDLVGVVDIKSARAKEVAAQYGTTPFTNASDLLGRVDAVSIATPTMSHVAVALPFVESGAAVLVEKPLAPSVADADCLLAAADAHGTVLATGHTERFNPAVAAALPIVSEPRFVEIHRLGTFPERSLDIDVIFDLMIHDLDVLLATVGSEVESVEAVGVSVLTSHVDIANARLRFASGCIANVTASRISRDRVRKARFFQHDAYISIDYAAQELEVYRLASRAAANARVDLSTIEGQKNDRPEIQGGRVDIAVGEPLRLELNDFITAVRDRRNPIVTGHDGRAALALAARIAEQL